MPSNLPHVVSIIGNTKNTKQILCQNPPTFLFYLSRDWLASPRNPHYLPHTQNGLIGLHNSPPSITVSTLHQHLLLFSAYPPWKIPIQLLHSWSLQTPKYNNFRKHLLS
ncbi:hypothetical protein L1887_05680 [Cichorium endivia]|nr:hypothetical protein L1887_05680 [Cichorium endivia]